MTVEDGHNRAAARMLAHAENGTTDSAPDIRRVPVADYLDTERWQREMEVIFRRAPLMLALSIELAGPGAYKTIEAAGKPVLMVRGSDGQVRAFLNVCSHRQAMVAEGCGKASRFTCPYHGWTYNAEGRLVGLSDRQKFGEVDTAGLNLVALPCAERAGMVFVSLTPGAEFDIEAYLAGFLPDLEWLGLENWYLHGITRIDGASWKVVTDGFLENYHFATAHADTIFARNLSNTASFDFFGPHIRLGLAGKWVKDLRGRPEGDYYKYDTDEFGFVRFVFPNLAIAVGRNQGGSMTQIMPGPTPDRTIAYQHLIFPKAPETEEERARCDAMEDFLREVVTREDFDLGFRIQRGLESGAYEHMVFGRNEWGNQHYHASIEAFLREPSG
ncbi:aromatic ring-hydroxylating dioxygenase subunit alpha [Iodidimonas sp. SYSU 1G8]|uniref:aromatic ring-hydroxylating oxygenase subunit alpha n=1 Tax=Iodidimonas sp. SYSU 1G8 TaxID=3133967 RepID=UPI0031FE6DAD